MMVKLMPLKQIISHFDCAWSSFIFRHFNHLGLDFSELLEFFWTPRGASQWCSLSASQLPILKMLCFHGTFFYDDWKIPNLNNQPCKVVNRLKTFEQKCTLVMGRFLSPSYQNWHVHSFRQHAGCKNFKSKRSFVELKWAFKKSVWYVNVALGFFAQKIKINCQDRT